MVVPSFKAIKPSRKAILSILVIIGLAVAGFFASEFLFGERGEAREFIGQVEKVENNVISAHGVFINPDSSEVARNGFNQEVKITVSSKTAIVKILVYMPTREELEATDGRWNPAELRKEETTGTLSGLTYNKEGLSIRVIADENIFNKSQFTANRIEYVEEVYKDRPQ